MSFCAVIPARFASNRLPGKPLLDIGGKPMIQHVYERVCASAAARVCIATDDARIADAAERFGAEVCMTANTHQSGTDRIEEVARRLGWSDQQVVVNVQGDEPLISPALIDQVAGALLRQQAAGMSSLFELMHEAHVLQSRNVVKVVIDSHGYALYFSRAPIPWQEPDEEGRVLARRHIGIYAYRVATLKQFVNWPQTSLECAESLEQLRMLENGVRIHMSEAVVQVPGGVDTEEDLERVRALLRLSPA